MIRATRVRQTDRPTAITVKPTGKGNGLTLDGGGSVKNVVQKPFSNSEILDRRLQQRQIKMFACERRLPRVSISERESEIEIGMREGGYVNGVSDGWEVCT